MAVAPDTVSRAPAITYTILPLLNTHIYKIILQFIPNTNCSTLKLPTWIPGSYMIREFSKNIISINVKQQNIAVICEQIDKNTWQISGYKLHQQVDIEYEVYAFDFGIRTAYLDSKRGYFNPTSLCLGILDYENLAHIIQFNNMPPTWNVATGLTYVENQYLAANYNELIDAPFELGEFIRLSFEVYDIPHYIILSGTITPSFDSKRFIKDITTICQTQMDLFGGVAPFTNYTFLLYLGGEIYTGLEHANSTALMAPYYAVSTSQMNKINDDYLKLLGLISHEYFHLWNIKRIKPQVFNPYDLYTENYTGLLWWFEGITSYYDDLVLYRAGLIDKKYYLQIILDNINNIYKYSGVTKQSLLNSSITAWVKFYRPDENSPNSLVSYYIKGALVGLCLDLIIRNKSDRKSLDDVLLGLYNKWLEDGQGIAEEELSDLIKKYTGCDLAKEILDYTTTTNELPLKQLFEKYGLDLIKISANYASSGKILPKDEELAPNNKLSLGIKSVKETIGYKVINVYDKTPASESGLAGGDILIAFDNVKLTDLDKQLSLYTVNSQFNVTLFRQEQLLTVRINPKSDLTHIYNLKITDEEKLSNWL
ncbi:MAG: peptidase [Burkholderiales bacterium]|nr:peptidase [Burkholderiales bacterium]